MSVSAPGREVRAGADESAPAATARTARPHDRGFGPWELARAEGGRLLRNPITLFGIALSIVTFMLSTWGWAPVLQSDDVLTGLGLLPFAGATFLVTNLAVTRSRRHGTDELYESVPVGPRARTVGHLLSVVYAVGISCVLVTAMIGYRLLQHPVGRPSALELLTGPVAVALAGVIGVAAGRWWPQAASGPVLLVGLAGIQLYLQLQLSGGGFGVGKPTRWLALWVPKSVSGDPARELVSRPAEWHLVYLLALGVAVGGVALLRHRPRVPATTALAGGLLVTILAASMQIHGPTSARVREMADLLRQPELYQVCEVHQGVRYCAFRSYARFIDRWRAGIEPLLAELPPDAHLPNVEVIQTLVLYGSDIEGRVNLNPANVGGQGSYLATDDLGAALRPTSQWGAGPKEGTYQLGLDLVVAAMAVGLPRRLQDMPLTRADIRSIASRMEPQSRAGYLANTKPGDPSQTCSTLGQARAVVALWLAAAATPQTARAFRQDFEVDYRLHHQGRYTSVGPYFYDDAVSTVQIFNFPVNWGVEEGTYADELLRRPKADVLRTLRANWGPLIDPATKSDEVARLFGLKVLPSLVGREVIDNPEAVQCR